MDQLGPNALGGVLEPGRVADCYLGLLTPGSAGEPEAATILIVARSRCCILEFPSPTGAWCMSC